MDYADLTNLSLVCLVAGLTLFVTSRRLAQRARLYQAGMQSLLQLGRYGDIYDSLADTLGVLIGYSIYQLSLKRP